MRASPLEIEARVVRPSVLSAWLRESMAVHLAVAVLLCDDAECARLNAARASGVRTEPLRMTYDALLWRYEREVTDGRQLELFCSDQDAELRRQWSLFATSYVCRRGRAEVQRWVLQATLGLPRGVDRTIAASLLLSDVLAISLRYW
ncbi:MAG: hypothetical protein ABI699_01375 [Caldimonas sp.]